MRWFQYGAFCPLFRLHGFRIPNTRVPTLQGGPNEVWSFGEEVYGILKEFLFLRERLRPYIMEQMRTAQREWRAAHAPAVLRLPEGCCQLSG